MTQDDTTPYWLGGDETCSFCLQRYHYEAEYRCVGCDRAVCPQCVVIVRLGSAWCPECRPDETEER